MNCTTLSRGYSEISQVRWFHSPALRSPMKCKGIGSLGPAVAPWQRNCNDTVLTGFPSDEGNTIAIAD